MPPCTAIFPRLSRQQSTVPFPTVLLSFLKSLIETALALVPPNGQDVPLIEGQVATRRLLRQKINYLIRSRMETRHLLSLFRTMYGGAVDRFAPTPSSVASRASKFPSPHVFF